MAVVCAAQPCCTPHGPPGQRPPRTVGRMTETWRRRPPRRWLLGSVVALSAAGIIGIGVTDADAPSTVTTVVGPLNVRTGPTTKATVVGQVPNGGTVKPACNVTGEQINGRILTTDPSDRPDSGPPTSHAHVRGA